MSTLADEILKESYDKRTMLGFMADRPTGEIRDLIIRAHRFVLDKPMSRFMADLSTAVYRTADKVATLNSMRHSALLPHDVTWVEFNGHEFRQRVTELDCASTLTGEPLAPISEIPERWGLLLERHPRIPTATRMTEFLGGQTMVDRQPVVMPISHVWNVADAPLPWAGVCHKSGMLAHGVIGHIDPYIGVLMPASHMKEPRWLSKVVIDDIAFVTHSMVPETAGVTRYALAFLAALSAMPATHHRVEPGRKYYVRGHYKRFLDHTEIRLNLPARANPFKVARKLIAKVHHRAHKVREHFRVYERKADVGCDHLWGPVDDNNHSRCKRCTSWRTRIVEHVRGDASLGWVQHSYKVTHAA